MLRHQTERFAAVCQAIDADAGGDDGLGEFILSAWQGTLLRMKVERDVGPIRRFRRTLVSMLRNR